MDSDGNLENDILITTENNEFIIFKDYDETQPKAPITHTITQTTSSHAALINDNAYLLQGDETGLNIHSIDNNSMTLISNIKTGQVKDVSTINGHNAFYVLNDSGTLFIYEFKENEANLISTMQTSFSDQLAYQTNDADELLIWASHDKTLNVFNAQLPTAQSVITNTQTDSSTQTDTQTSTTTQTQTDTSTQTQIDPNADISTPISNTADNKPENVKVGQVNYILLMALFGLVILSRRKVLIKI